MVGMRYRRPVMRCWQTPKRRRREAEGGVRKEREQDGLGDGVAVVDVVSDDGLVGGGELERLKVADLKRLRHIYKRCESLSSQPPEK
jgi:hypothetical protein